VPPQEPYGFFFQIFSNVSIGDEAVKGRKKHAYFEEVLSMLQ
jgi:hypothetical protein